MPVPVPVISRNLFDLSGYCSIVTGAGQGIGLALAEALASAGSDLVLTERNSEHLEVGASKIEAIGRKVTTVACDVAADDTSDRLVKAALDLSGRIDVLINNAGLMTFADMLTVEDAVWDNIYAINVRAPMRIMRAVLPEMVKAKRGSVINIGSSWSSRASVFNQDGGGVDYCSSKAALNVAAKGVRVNVIAPGAVDTPMHADHRAKLFEYEKYIPLGRMQFAEDLAGTAIFLASDASGYITGQTLHVNGGLIMND